MLGTMFPQFAPARSSCILLVLHFLQRAVLISLSWLAASGWAADMAVVRTWLSEPLLEPDLPLEQVQAYTERRVLPMPELTTATDWAAYARDLRKTVLDEVVFRGEARQWRSAKLGVERLETLPGGPGYRLIKLRYEVVPGMWVPAILYEPEQLQGKVPVMLNVNGHDGKGKAAEYKQRRCIHMARNGILALNTEWFGMGQLNHTNNLHYRMNQLDLCGTSGLAPFYLAMSRALDLLLDHPHADPTRVGVAGLSGGGWQTIVISSLDERVTFANPVAGYSSFATRARHIEDLGDSEQTPTDLAAFADYAHLTALLAPRPALLTFNAKDNCCFASGHAMAPLLNAAQPVYDLLGASDRLTTHVNEDPGDHNFEADNRRALYASMARAFSLDEDGFVKEAVPEAGEIRTLEALSVPLPELNQTFASLALALSRELPRAEAPPESPDRARVWQANLRGLLSQRVKVPPYRISGDSTGDRAVEGLTVRPWVFRIRGDWTLPGLEICPADPRKTVLMLGDAGRKELAEPVLTELARGHRVIAVDLFYLGESQIAQRDFLFALLVASTGERPLGIQVGQVQALVRWAQGKYRYEPVEVHAHGPRTSLAALLATALEPAADHTTHLHGALGSLKQVLEGNWAVNQRPEWFCFGLLETADVAQITALAAPHPVTFHEPSERLRRELDWLPGWYERLEAPGKLVME